MATLIHKKASLPYYHRGQSGNSIFNDQVRTRSLARALHTTCLIDIILNDGGPYHRKSSSEKSGSDLLESSEIDTDTFQEREELYGGKELELTNSRK